MNRRAAILLLCLLPWPTARAQPASPRDTAPDTWAATDGLGRSLPDDQACGPPRPGKFVGIFYFLWLQPEGGRRPTKVFDISKLLTADADHPAWGPPGAFHWWAEPRLGYYRSDDEYVIRKHAQLLCDAGIDVIIFDVTNALTYDATFLTVCRVFDEIRREGGRTPQVAFLARSDYARVVRHLYEDFYAKNLYPGLWFRWAGKPLILSPEATLGPDLRVFFTFRESWAWTDAGGWFGDGKDKWPWLDHTPQKFGWHDRADAPEQICVCVAEHPITNIGRSFHDGHEPPPAGRSAEGLYFAEQWKRALAVDPPFIFVTGWNEWIAQRFVRAKDGPASVAGRPLHPGDTYFVDTYSQEFSRDIEPMRGGHGDAYYYQLAANVRRFKGVRPAPRASAAKSIRVDDHFEQWAEVGPAYLDDLYDTTARDKPGYADAGPYVNRSGRNDFDCMKVARDEQNVYFYARTREPITEPAGDAWMSLLIDADRDAKTGWAGYDFVVNRGRSNRSTCRFERWNGRGWESVADVPMVRRGREMHVAVPRRLLGLEPGKGPLQFDFKWADNAPLGGETPDFLDQGDVAPNARFNYRFRE